MVIYSSLLYNLCQQTLFFIDKSINILYNRCFRNSIFQSIFSGSPGAGEGSRNLTPAVSAPGRRLA